MDCHEQLLAACISALLVLGSGTVAWSSLQRQRACPQHTVACVGSAGPVCPVRAFSSAGWGRFSTGDTSTWASFQPPSYQLVFIRKDFLQRAPSMLEGGVVGKAARAGKVATGNKSWFTLIIYNFQPAHCSRNQAVLWGSGHPDP